MRVHLFTCGVLLLAFSAPGSDAQTDCGIAPLNTKVQTRIVGGQTAAAGSWPWQAYLQIPVNSTFFDLCGGSLITNQWVLSAAHCFNTSDPSGVTIYLGLQTTNGTDPNLQQFSASKIIRHPNYNQTTHDNDLALLQLSSNVTFNNYISPVCLPTVDSLFPAGLNCWVTGFGTTSSGGSASDSLQEVVVPIVSNAACNVVYGSITSDMICAGLPQGGKDSCQGDSGGPLVTKNGTRWVQAGVVSFGEGCALPNIPGVYARVSQYQDWISSTVTGTQPGFVIAASEGTGAVTSGTAAVTSGTAAVTTGTGAVTVGTEAVTTGTGAVTSVTEAVTSGTGAVTVGTEAVTSVTETVTTGTGAVTVGTEAVTSVTEAVTSVTETVTTGTGAVTVGTEAVTTGTGAVTSVTETVTSGTGAVTSGTGAVAVGSGANGAGHFISLSVPLLLSIPLFIFSLFVLS